MSNRPKILVTQKVHPVAYPLLEAVGDVEANRDEGVIWSYADCEFIEFRGLALTYYFIDLQSAQTIDSLYLSLYT